MNGMKSVFVCVLIVLLGNVFLLAHAQAPEAAASPKPAASTERITAEKSVLAESSKQAAKPEAAAEFCQCVGQGDPSATERIERTLTCPLHQTGLDYPDQPLQDVVTQLADEYGIPIQIDKSALEEAGIATDERISVTIHNVSLRSALRLMLRRSQLTWIIQDEVLMITTKEDAEHQLVTCVFDVRRIAGDNGDLTPLIDAISSCVAKETWAKNGKGSGEIRPIKPGLLVITQTPAVHDDIRHLLTTLDKMRHDHPSEVDAAPIKAATGGSAERRASASPTGTRFDRPGAAKAPRAGTPPASDNPFGG